MQRNGLLPPQVSLRALRESHGLTIPDLAQRIGREGVEVNRHSIANIELGHRNGSPRLMAAWARALGVTRRDIRQADEIRTLVADSDLECDESELVEVA